MTKKDDKNETIGIISIIVIVILAVIGLYFFLMHHSPETKNAAVTVPTEAPAPINP